MYVSMETTGVAEHLVGRVKWFNTKAGYGFITVTDGPRAGSDIFVHHSSVKVDCNQYKYLVQGEYVEFDLGKDVKSNHDWNALNVGGIRGGKLMCETRYESKLAKTEHRASKAPSSTQAPATTFVSPTTKTKAPAMPKQKQTTDSRKPSASNTSWTTVVKKQPSEKKPSEKKQA